MSGPSRYSGLLERLGDFCSLRRSKVRYFQAFSRSEDCIFKTCDAQKTCREDQNIRKYLPGPENRLRSVQCGAPLVKKSEIFQNLPKDSLGK